MIYIAVYVGLALLQIVVLFSPLPQRLKDKRFGSFIIQVLYLTTVMYRLFFEDVTRHLYDLLMIPSFLIIFLLPRFKGVHTPKPTK